MKELEVLQQSGSDASYDLIVEAVRPRPDGGYIIESHDDAQREQAGKLLRQLTALLEPGGHRPEWGYRFRLFQRMPDVWVWAARLEAVQDKLARGARAAV
jgi:hypothetical protein